MATPIPTDGLQMLRQLVKDVDLLKRNGLAGRSGLAEPEIDGETITIPQANVTEGAVFYQDVELDAYAAVVGQQSFDDETILDDAELWVVMPSAPICSTDESVVSVEWDGYGPDGEAIPDNFIRLAVHRSLDPLFDADPLVTQVGVMTLPGVLVFSDQITDTDYYYRFVLHTADGRRSQQSDTGMGLAVPVTVDQDQIDAIVNEAVDEANAYTDSVVVGAGGNSITTSLNNPSGTPKPGDLWYKVTPGGEIIGQWIGTAGSPNTWVSMTTGGAVLTNVSAGSITTGTLDAARIAANSIRAKQMLLADTSNMAEVNESIAIGTIYDSTHAIVNGWSTRTSTASTYFMFRDQQGPVPFKTGDRIRVTFEALANSPVTANLHLWVYGGTTVFPALGSVAITTTPTVFAKELTITDDMTGRTTYMIGMQGVAGFDVYVRNVRAYVMNAGELIVDGSVTAKHIAAQSITAEKIALGTYSTNLIADPSFEEPYPIISTNAYHQWMTKDMVSAGAVSRAPLPNSGLFSGRLRAPAAGDAARIRSGVFPVVPGKSYTVSMNVAKEHNTSVATFACKVAGGSTQDLTEYPGGPSQASIVFAGDDPAALTGIDPIWISDNLYPHLLTVDANADGVHDGAVAYTSATVTTGTRSVSAAGQVLSAASIDNTGRWGVYGDLTVLPNIPHRITARYTGLAGTNARFRVYVEGMDSVGGGSNVSIGNTTVFAASGTAVVTTTPGNYDGYRVFMWLESTSGTTATSPTVTVTALDIEQVDATGLTNPILEMYERVSAAFTVPAGINYCALRLSIEGATAVQSMFVDDVSVVEVGRGGSELTAAGLRLFGADGTEVGAFVSNRPDYISVTDGLRTLASISQAGAISGQSLSIVGQDTDGDGVSDSGFEVFGTEFMDWINSRPQGIVARGIRDTSSPTGAANEFPVLELQFDQIPGRMYRVLWATGILNSVAGGYEVVTLRGTTNGTTPGITSPIMRGVRVDHGSASTRWSFGSKLLGEDVGGPVVDMRLLLSVDPENGNVSVSASAGAPTELWVEDIGPFIPDTGIDRTSTGGTPPPTLKTYTTTWTSTTACTYMGNGAKDSSQGSSDMKQGYSSYDGDSRSLWIFPSSMYSTLSGVTSDANITKVRIYLYANFWYNNSGGTALLKRHGYTSVPGSSPSMTTLESSSSWPKPGGRWVDITSDSGVKAALRSGSFRGIGVGPAGSTSHTYYGRFNKSGAKIEVTYKK